MANLAANRVWRATESLDDFSNQLMWYLTCTTSRLSASRLDLDGTITDEIIQAATEIIKSILVARTQLARSFYEIYPNCYSLDVCRGISINSIRVLRGQPFSYKHIRSKDDSLELLVEYLTNFSLAVGRYSEALPNVVYGISSAEILQLSSALLKKLQTLLDKANEAKVLEKRMKPQKVVRFDEGVEKLSQVDYHLVHRRLPQVVEENRGVTFAKAKTPFRLATSAALLNNIDKFSELDCESFIIKQQRHAVPIIKPKVNKESPKVFPRTVFCTNKSQAIDDSIETMEEK